MTRNRLLTVILLLFPIAVTAWIWLSALSFVPVPWPDDSAFYFVGRELFKWPPRWVMLPQAPFEPTYRIFNFNTMPLYPILIGLGRFVGIDGSHLIKLWPLSAFALSASLLGVALFRRGLPWIAAFLIGFVTVMDPVLRWASVLVRPESLIGLAGLALVLGLCLGFPERFKPRKLWHPVAALLALGAYAHFNAVHLLFPVVLAYASTPRELVAIGLRTALYLVPWLITVALQPGLFFYQMRVQWTRLAGGNDWLKTWNNALNGVFQDMGSPEPWPTPVFWTAYAVWALMLLALGWGLLAPLARQVCARLRHQECPREEKDGWPRLLPAGGWVLGSIWLWENKPEVWFTYYLHLAVWTFAGVAGLKLWSAIQVAGLRIAGLALVSLCVVFSAGVYGYVNVSQAYRLGQSASWHWPVYHDYVECIDQELKRVEERLGHPRPFRVWNPTFPDVTVELSRRHPDWEFTRTNDFWERSHLAIEHGREVESVVVSETINWAEREISAPQSAHPDIRSTWMTWDAHFLNKLWIDSRWKPDHRYLCQRGRWQAFIFSR